MRKVLLVAMATVASLLFSGVIMWAVRFGDVSISAIPGIAAVVWAESRNDFEQADRARFERVGHALKEHQLVSKYAINRDRTFEVVLVEKWSKWDFAARDFAGVLCDANNPDFLFRGQHLHGTWKVEVLRSDYQPGANCVVNRSSQ